MAFHCATNWSTVLGMASEIWYPNEGEVLEERWEIVKKLGVGAFGAVFEAKDRKTGELAACKLEHKKSVVHILKWEVMVMRQMTQAGAVHATRILDWGRGPKKNYVYLCMTLVGQNLDKVKEKLPPSANKRFSLRTALHIGMETVDALRELHDAGYLHRDVKPENFAVGRPPNAKRIYLLDLGMVRQWRRSDGKPHRPREMAAFRGNFKYASVNSLNQNEQGRADDLWSWLYMLIDLTTGSLPYTEEMEGDDIYEQMTNLGLTKQKVAETNALTKNCPKEYLMIQKQLEQLTYESKPNYKVMRNALYDVFKRNKFTDQQKVDWEDGAEHTQLNTAKSDSSVKK